MDRDFISWRNHREHRRGSARPPSGCPGQGRTCPICRWGCLYVCVYTRQRRSQSDCLECLPVSYQYLPSAQDTRNTHCPWGACIRKLPRWGLFNAQVQIAAKTDSVCLCVFANSKASILLFLEKSNSILFKKYASTGYYPPQFFYIVFLALLKPHIHGLLFSGPIH